jgi:matrix metalloproteinase-14 (membrane-inserted)
LECERERHVSPSPDLPSVTGICSDTRLDAIVRTDSGDSYVFQGEQYWRLTDDNVAPGYPKR